MRGLEQHGLDEVVFGEREQNLGSEWVGINEAGDEPADFVPSASLIEGNALLPRGRVNQREIVSCAQATPKTYYGLSPNANLVRGLRSSRG